MASARGFWLRDQISARFGACAVGATTAGVTGLLSAASCVVWAVVVGEEDAVEDWRVVVRVRTAARRGRAAAAARRRVVAVVSMVGWWMGVN
jgi:hypothetical protein